MLEEQEDTIEEIRKEQEDINDTKMTDKDNNTSTQQQETTINTTNTPTGVNRQ
jgi:hypothetical protein